MKYKQDLSRGVDIMNFHTAKDPKRDELMLVGRIDVKAFKSARASVSKLARPRPSSLRLGIRDFDPRGREGQVCPLHLFCPMKTFYERATEQWPARREGVRVRNLARLYENAGGNSLWTLHGSLVNTNMTRLLAHLKDEAGDTLSEVELVARRTPLRTEKQPVWTLYIALAGEAELLQRPAA
jgi:hypothetical protein